MENIDFNSLKSSVKYWWLSLILGILLIVMGFWVMNTPRESYITLAIFFSWLLFFKGIMEMVFAISNKDSLKGWGWYLAGGLVDFILGGFLTFNPNITMAILPFLVGFWMMFGGVSSIATAFEFKSYDSKGWGWLMFVGIITIIFSILIIYNPILGGFYLVFMTAFALISFGIFRIMLSFRLKKLRDSLD